MPAYLPKRFGQQKIPVAVLTTSLLLLLQSCANTESDKGGKAIPVAKFDIPPELNIKGVGAVDTCSGSVQSSPLLQPQEISPDPATGILQTELVVRLKERCVPVWDKDKGWQWQTLSLRTYGFPKDHSKPIDPSDPDDPNIAWSAPGPTFILNAGSAPDRADGSRFKMTLHNYLPVQSSYDTCDPLDGATNPNYTFPNCFHGSNVTNFHFHGFHISPQEHQDYVLLSLLPHGATDSGHAAHSRGETAIGQYSYDVAPLLGNQAPGTHWYHAHKHGATALQVLNGLVGTFEVHGEFDKELDAFFAKQGHTLEDRLMVVQQLEEQLPGLGGTKAQHPLVNGQANPVVNMKPGEIQRWRFVGATMQASAQLNIGFEEEFNGSAPDPIVRQIAQDGVQFAPENYKCQTLINGPDCVPKPVKIEDFTLNPGNRIDILIKAPSVPGTYYMTHEVIGNIADKEADQIKERSAKITAVFGTANPPLLTLVVGGPETAMQFPTQAQFPKLPGYLADLTVPSGSSTNIAYQMAGRGQAGEVHFSINNKPYDPSCVNESFVLDQAKQWQLENNSSIAHPFHIHTNPFQLISTTEYDKQGNAEVKQYKSPYVWMDTFAIPVASTTGDKPNGKAVIRYEALDFTGEFVNHCHILGHEDRGMMQNVQATCSNGNWGSPNMTGAPECAIPNVPPPPLCTTQSAETSAGGGKVSALK